MRRSTLVTGHKKSSRSEQKPLMAKKMATRWRDYIVRRFFRVSTVVSGSSSGRVRSQDLCRY